jgi:hypothetical protein
VSGEDCLDATATIDAARQIRMLLQQPATWHR